MRRLLREDHLAFEGKTETKNNSLNGQMAAKRESTRIQTVRGRMKVGERVWKHRDAKDNKDLNLDTTWKFEQIQTLWQRTTVDESERKLQIHRELWRERNPCPTLQVELSFYPDISVWEDVNRIFKISD